MCYVLVCISSELRRVALGLGDREPDLTVQKCRSEKTPLPESGLFAGSEVSLKRPSAHRKGGRRCFQGPNVDVCGRHLTAGLRPLEAASSPVYTVHLQREK